MNIWCRNGTRQKRKPVLFQMWRPTTGSSETTL